MSTPVWIVGEIIVGIALITVVVAAVTVWSNRLMGKGPSAEQILRERYARGNLTHEQFQQVCRDLGITVSAGTGLHPAPNGRDVGAITGSRSST